MAAVIYVILIAVALSLAIFAVVVQRGASIVNLDKRLIGSGLTAGAIQLAACLAGYGIGKAILHADIVDKHSTFWVHVLAGILLAIVGIRMLFQAVQKKTILEHRVERINMKNDSIAFFRLCLNALVAGVACGILEVTLWVLLVGIFVTALVFVLLGYYSGRAFGDEFSRKAYAIGGSILCALGVCLQVFGV